MKKIFNIIFIGLSIQFSFAQAHQFTDLGVLFTQKALSGTAKYQALSGAMGALGGDISVINHNPAGLGVFNHNDFSVSLGTNNKSTTTNYYEISNTYNDSDFGLNQIGLAFVFEVSNTNWNKAVLAFNYQKNNNYDNYINPLGNNNFATFRTHPNSLIGNDYDQALEQDLENATFGSSSVFNIGLASQYKDNFYLGGSINIHNIDFVQDLTIYEANQNSSGDVLESTLNQYDSNKANGVSVNIGMIYKITSSVRLGLAYESPTWFNSISNESNIYNDNNSTRIQGNGKYEVKNTDGTPVKGNIEHFTTDKSIINHTPVTNSLRTFEYQLKTANKFNLSSAFILGKKGLFSLDYGYHNYTNISLPGNSELSTDNNYFSNILVNTHNIRGGGEIRINNLTLRGGASYEQSPYHQLKTNSIDVLKFGDRYGASLGAGLRIENHKFDLSYNYSQQSNTYDFYDNYDEIAPVNIDQKNSKVNVTYTYVF